jgi:magnesium chelatase accessory protein
VRHRPHDWHLQEIGEGPELLFLHGAGASTHSWRDVVSALAPRWRCIAIDLPGQGFTSAGTLRRCGLEAMTEDVAYLCEAEGWRPVAIVGHSAGAAIALNLSLRLGHHPAVVGINAALGHFRGVASWLFPLVAKLLALNPLTARIFTIGGRRIDRARRLIEGTGSQLDETGLAYYSALISDTGHVDATLQMMTQWNIDPLLERLPQVSAPVLLIVGGNDLAVPPQTSVEVSRRLPNAQVVELPALGHLAHEESPQDIAGRVDAFLETMRPRRAREVTQCRCS